MEPALSNTAAGPGLIPSDLLGDWLSNGDRFRFNYDGVYSKVISASYSIDQSNRLNFGTDPPYLRTAGTQGGIIGTWRSMIQPGSWFDMTFGPFHFYAYQWANDDTGGGYYSIAPAILTLIETRALVRCIDNAITMATSNGIFSGTFQVSGNDLTLDVGGASVSYKRVVPFLP